MNETAGGPTFSGRRGGKTPPEPAFSGSLSSHRVLAPQADPRRDGCPGMKRLPTILPAANRIASVERGWAENSVFFTARAN